MENKTNIPPKPTPKVPGAKPITRPVAKPVAKPVSRPVTKPAPKPEKPKSDKKSDPVKPILVAIIILLLGGVAYLLYDKFDNAKQTATETQKNSEIYKNDIDSKVAEITRLQDSLKTIIAEKEALGLELSEERAKLAELEELKIQVQHHQVSINSLNNQLAKYQKKYKTVSASIESLSAENQQLISEKTSMEQMLKAKNDSIKVLTELKEALEEKVTIASDLKVENINVSVINTTGRELPAAQSYRAMLVLKVKISVKLAENKIIKGKKEVYLRFIDPSGTAAFEGEKIFIADGKKTFYTEKQTIDFDKAQNSVTFLFNKGSRFRPGKYMIEIYADGKKLGDGHLTLTK